MRFPSGVQHFIHLLPSGIAARVAWACIVLLHVVFLIYALNHEHCYTVDSSEYLFAAENMKQGMLYAGPLNEKPEDPSLFSRRTPGYPLFLLISGGGMITLLIQLSLSLFSIHTGLRILRLFQPPPSAELIYLSLFCLQGSQMVYSSMYMTELLFQSVLVYALFLLLKSHWQITKAQVMRIHVLMAALYLIKPIALFCWVPVSLYLFLRWRKMMGTYLLLIPVLIHLGIIGSISWNNYRQTGVIEYSNISRKVILNYTVPELLKSDQEKGDVAKDLIRFQDSLAKMDYRAQCTAADDYIRNTLQAAPGKFLFLQMKGVSRFLFDTGRWDLECWRLGYQHVDETPSLMRMVQQQGVGSLLSYFKSLPTTYTLYYLLTAISYIVTGLLFLYGCFSSPVPVYAKTMIGCTVLYFALLSGPSASARFRIPVGPMIVLVAAASLSNRQLFHFRRNNA